VSVVAAAVVGATLVAAVQPGQAQVQQACSASDGTQWWTTW
jgi:hypothetical protein